MQAFGQCDCPLLRWALETQIVDRVVGDQIHDGVFSGEQADDVVHFFFAVIDPFQQSPLILDRVRRAAGVLLTEFNQLGRVDAGRFGQQAGA